MKKVTLFVSCALLICAVVSAAEEEALWCSQVPQTSLEVGENENESALFCDEELPCCQYALSVLAQCYDYQYGLLDGFCMYQLTSYCLQFDPLYYEYCLTYYNWSIYEGCIWDMTGFVIPVTCFNEGVNAFVNCSNNMND